MAVSAAVAASPMWPSVSAVASDLSSNDLSKVAKKLNQQHHAERVLLEYGDESTAVAELQRELGIADDGVYGPHTRAAVKEFQKKHRLLATGKVDVKTWLKLFPTDMVVYAPPGSKTALGVNDTDQPQWAAVSTNPNGKADDGAAKLGHAAAAKAAKRGKGKSDPGTPSVRAASIGAAGPAVGISPSPPSSGGPGLGIPGLHGGALAPGGGGGGGGGGGSFHFPPLSSFGSAKEMIRAMIRMANRIDSKHYGYRWGGGHNSSFSGPYDCSGAVSAVLHAAGLLSSPMVSGGFMRWGAPGRGAVTIYANAGHVYMSILGRYFGTTRMNPGGGAGWFPGAPRSGFAVVHVPFSKLKFKSHKKKRSKKRHRRKRRATQQTAPLNQPATTPAPNSGGTQAPSGSSTTTTTASRQSTSTGTTQTAPAPSSQPVVTPNVTPAEPVQPAQPVQQVQSMQAPNAPSAAPTAPPVTGTGGPAGSQTPNPAPAPQQAPAAPAPSAPSGQGPAAAVPQAPKPEVAQPNPPQAQQPQQGQRPQLPATAAPQAVEHAGPHVGQGASSTQPPRPPAGQGQGSTPNSGK